MQTITPIEKVEQSMQAEVSVKDVQTSPRKEDMNVQEETVSVVDVVPQVVEELVIDIVHKMPFKVITETQETITETNETRDKDTQTKTQNESIQHQGDALPYEIHIQTSFIIPEEIAQISADQPSSKQVIEIEKSFIIDENQSGSVRETESTNEEKIKKSKSKKKKKNKNLSEQSKEADLPKLSEENFTVEEDLLAHDKPSDRRKEPEQNPTIVTLNITKTTVYETSNLLSRERRPHGSSVNIEEVMSKQTPGKSFYLKNSVSRITRCHSNFEYYLIF